MKASPTFKIAVLALELAILAAPGAEALPNPGGSSPMLRQEPVLVAAASKHRPPRASAPRPKRPAAGAHRPSRPIAKPPPPPPRSPTVRPAPPPPPVTRPVAGWAGRPGWYRWPAGGAVAAGAALGFITAASAAAWAGPPPQPGLCWYYTEPGQRQGFWDVCP